MFPINHFKPSNYLAISFFNPLVLFINMVNPLGYRALPSFTWIMFSLWQQHHLHRAWNSFRTPHNIIYERPTVHVILIHPPLCLIFARSGYPNTVSPFQKSIIALPECLLIIIKRHPSIPSSSSSVHPFVRPSNPPLLHKLFHVTRPSQQPYHRASSCRLAQFQIYVQFIISRTNVCM